MQDYEFFREIRRLIVSDEEYGDLYSPYWRERHGMRSWFVQRLNDEQTVYNRRRSDPVLRSLLREFPKDFCATIGSHMTCLPVENQIKMVQLCSNRFGESAASELYDKLPGGRNFFTADATNHPDAIFAARMMVGQAYIYRMPLKDHMNHFGKNMDFSSSTDNSAYKNGAFAVSLEILNPVAQHSIYAIAYYFEKKEDEVMMRVKYPS